MLKTQLNFPVDARIIGDLVADVKDLQLMMPTAEIPFNEAQWRERLAPTEGTISVLVKDELGVVGHFAFLRTHQPVGETVLGLVYLHPRKRGTSFATEMITASEKLAVELLNIKTMYLNVKAFNTPAHKLYLKLGYQECGRTDDTIRMRKTLLEK